MVSRDLFRKKVLLQKNATEAGEYDSWFAVLEKKDIDQADDDDDDDDEAAVAAGD